ncbi:TIGR03668 family PPOX class F420-dependent oxidoreductase [Streptomyces rapamycinicus]|uniref:PPOX class F420-dependent enzyme n=2 Tax=Streptomyces rapamycinicus TaxID=1226757 RepID=A0A0A0N9Q8_STRRN|nr:TIGR03668 family PPOX class F420-dependent oxidoreductase [Streptomyces rapamycinicus]AGP52838.1 PPOX class F420-dependent enzyme [Streptomyces rapamycinicus NRRL 5491]MBB4780312.1 PPOX class probable F420-dependent enzyme [Streptomyces rapamycinicus]RLV75033.1 PPOX class F420-dependent enzyme [Streptomyces rapamycinicus NRRL 5491]UTO61046.1 TIGR03668 family PPOX class F420-dependent oxidoreductase [Streptomyces rapamycinicus]UTP28990.1 TIGR03668 family PPOX class F420-dependent oxidoreduct
MPQLTGAQARERFARARLARLATVGAEDRPHLVPVVFALTGDTVVTAVDHKPKRTTRLKRLDNIRAHPAVCLLVDDYDENWDHLWWARADGTARVLPPADESPVAADHVRLLVDTYPAQYRDRPPRGPVVEITVDRWSGWRAD